MSNVPYARSQAAVVGTMDTVGQCCNHSVLERGCWSQYNKLGEQHNPFGKRCPCEKQKLLGAGIGLESCNVSLFQLQWFKCVGLQYPGHAVVRFARELMERQASWVKEVKAVSSSCNLSSNLAPCEFQTMQDICCWLWDRTLSLEEIHDEVSCILASCRKVSEGVRSWGHELEFKDKNEISKPKPQSKDVERCRKIVYWNEHILRQMPREQFSTDYRHFEPPQEKVETETWLQQVVLLSP